MNLRRLQIDFGTWKLRPARDSGLRPPARQASWPRPGDLARTLQSRSAVSLSSVERLPPRPRSAVEPKALKGFKTVVRGGRQPLQPRTVTRQRSCARCSGCFLVFEGVSVVGVVCQSA